MPTIEYPEPMARFQCNLQGCCCKQWVIPFQPPDLRRLIEHMTDDELAETLRGGRFDSLPDGRLGSFVLRSEPPDERCQFLATDGRCGLQVGRGEEILPTICRAYPAGAIRSGDVRQMVWDVACPEVLERLDESDDRLEVITEEVGDDHPLAVRARLRFNVPQLRLGGTEIGFDGFERIRRGLLAAFNDRRGSVLQTLSAANWALWRVTEGEDCADFELRDEPADPFLRFFERCVWTHGPVILRERLERYRRFVFAVDLSGAVWSELQSHLLHREDWRSVLDPDDPEIAPLLFRYLAHRSYAPFGVSFETSHADLVFGALTHYVATALRLAIGLIGWLGLTDRRGALKVALGASEHFYRGVRDMPTSVMPWFNPERYQ